MTHRVIACLACAGFFVGIAWGDQVAMKNGDRITGSIIMQDGKTITVKTDLFGTVTAPWDQVDSVRSDQPVTVAVKDGRTVSGTLSTRDGRIEVTAQGTAVGVVPGDVAAIRNAEEQRAYERRLRPNLWQLWAGDAAIGWAGAHGNATALTFTTSAAAFRTTNTDKTSVYFNLIQSSARVNGVKADTAQAVRGGWAYDRNLVPRVFFNVFNDYEYDKFQNLDLRYVVGGGVGFHAIKTESGMLDFLGGGDYNHARFGTPLTRSFGEIFGGDEYTFKFPGPSSLVQSFRIFANPSNSSEYRINFDLSLLTKLNSRITWNLALSDRYLNLPAPGRQRNDWLYTTGFGLSFGK